MRGLDWRPIFLLNLPIGLITLVAAVRLLEESRGRGGSLDIVGILLISAAVLLLTVPLVEGRAVGWPAWAFVCLAAALPVAILFGWWEARRIRDGREPLVDIRLFRNRAFAAGVAIGLTYFTGFIGLVFALSLYLQIGLGWSALTAGLVLLPFAAGSFVGSSLSDGLARRLGRGVLWLGSGLVILGIVALLGTIRLVGVGPSGWEFLPSLLVAGIGSGFVIAPNVDLVLATVPWQQAGAAGGVLNTTQRLGNALGVAVVGVALFGTLGTSAGTAANAAMPELRARLGMLGMPPAAIDSSVAEFAHCFELRANANDPSVTPPGCPSPSPDDPIASAFADAASAAQRRSFTGAVQVAAVYALGAIVLTFLLVFALPRRQTDDATW